VTPYSTSSDTYRRRTTVDVSIGDLIMGSSVPIRIQSMTTTNTMDTQATIDQSIRMIEAGCELVRITAPSMREATNLEHIRNGLRERGYTTPLVADIHYTPNAAEIAARIVEKVRVNPGNYVDKKNFAVIEYDDASYAAELDRIRERFTPLVRICKEYGTAMRIGTNHGSLSDRIVNRYGDSPVGMVESALEFLRIAEDEHYYNIVLSMKSSNPLVMVQAYRLLVSRLQEEGLKPYPLHLGVTEAGDGEDGRVKSAVGIGTLLEDGLGDTIRVSLTEAPEAEIPVARALAERYAARLKEARVDADIPTSPLYPHVYHRRQTHAVATFGQDFVPRVIADLSAASITSMEDLDGIGHRYDAVTDKWAMSDQGCDYVYTGARSLPFMAPNGIREIVDLEVWRTLENNFYKVPLMSATAYLHAITAADRSLHSVVNIIRMAPHEATAAVLAALQQDPTVVVLLHSDATQWMSAMRACITSFRLASLTIPVLIERTCAEADADTLQLYTSTDVGGLLVEGYGDGVMLRSARQQPHSDDLAALNRLAFGILQAARTRMTKTEYISCPSCGRTLFDLEETTALIRAQTDHLKGVKIGIMGCIVNGPGEMADADYGYVGSGPDRITLYRGQDIVRRNIPAAEAVASLIDIIRSDDRWIER
jgi:(E)-4-hydroxy-3-methylbut-2-enyl-diphosphate synthase